LIDNKGKKTGLLLGLGLIMLALFALPNSTGYVSVIMFVLLLGLGGGIIVTAANALVSDISEERRATTLNLLKPVFGLGGLLTPAIGGFFLAGNTIALCYLVAVLTVVTFILHAPRPCRHPAANVAFKFSEASALLGRPALFLALVTAVFLLCILRSRPSELVDQAT